MMNTKSTFIFFVIFYNFIIESSFSQGVINLHFSSAGEIEFIVTDKWGRKTGAEPRGTLVRFNEIPQAGYGAEGYSDDMSFVTFNYKIVSPQDDGLYTIKLIGTNLNKFNFTISAQPDVSGQKFFKLIKTFLDKDAEMTYKFTYYGNPSTPSKVEKVIAITSLGQDIIVGGKLNLVGNQAFVNGLISKCSQMVNFFNAGNKTKAYNKLNEIKGSIQHAYNNPTGTQFVNDYANSVLMEDIQMTFQLIN